MPQNTDGLVLSHWHALFEDFSTSTQDFYTALEAAISQRNLPEVETSRILFSEGGVGSAKREYLRVRRNRIAFDVCSAPYGNGHFFSWWLARVPPKFGVFATIGIFVAAMFLTGMLTLVLSLMYSGGLAGWFMSVVAPFFLFPLVLVVAGYLVHEGLLGDEEWVMSLSVIGWLYVFVFNPLTYYRLDTAMMFRDSIRSAVNEVINELREEKGLRLLGEDELRPDVREEEATA